MDLTRACDPHPLKDLPQKSGEIFDVVDENDQVTGQNTRGEVHANRLLHRAVHVFVFNKRGDLLLQQRSMFKDVHPGVWDSSVSGHLDSGEDYAAAAVRELDEEMGIRVDEAPEEIARIAPCEETGWEHVRLYRCFDQRLGALSRGGGGGGDMVSASGDRSLDRRGGRRISHPASSSAGRPPRPPAHSPSQPSNIRSVTRIEMSRDFAEMIFMLSPGVCHQPPRPNSPMMSTVGMPAKFSGT